MVRVHTQVLTEARRKAWAEREAYRKALDGERRRLSRYRSVPRPSVPRPMEHRQVLQQAKRMAREGLDAHCLALEQNPWILYLVAMYEQFLNARRAKAKKKAEAKQPVAQELLSPSAAS